MMWRGVRRRGRIDVEGGEEERGHWGIRVAHQQTTPQPLEERPLPPPPPPVPGHPERPGWPSFPPGWTTEAAGSEAAACQRCWRTAGAEMQAGPKQAWRAGPTGFVERCVN